jgi:parallel beta-helix repeat protein
MLTPFALALLALPAGEPPVVTVTGDNTVIAQSCIVRIPPGTIIHDADSNGVLHVRADGITIEFEPGSVLAGAEIRENWNTLTGFGVRIDGRKNVTIRNAEVAGFKVGLYATHADGLTLDNLRFRDGYRQRLRSTPQKEDSADWMFPHRNDDREWMTHHGGAVVVERSKSVTLSNITVRTTQNGIILDRVSGAKVYDNDCSFLSGWGLAMWRSSDNVISRNAFDFCVRGHSEGVYNRGQDSAGILCFEQCSRNVFIENSVTHSGDGFFGFAGREALGEVPPDPEDGFNRPFDPKSAGCNDNLLIGNDFSYAPAHGVEITFSSGNRLIRNRIVENAICGVWGGYSRGTLIAGNHFEGNGGMAYGLERGGVNIEHGSDNRIIHNTFVNNLCGVHIWWDDDGALLQKPLVRANDKGASDNLIVGNTFEVNADHPFRSPRHRDAPIIVLQLRDKGEGHLKGNVYAANTVKLDEPRARELAIDAGCEPITELDGMIEEPEIRVEPLGEKRPVGARAHLRGRDRIIMTEWGPWDHTGEPPARKEQEGP